MSVILSTQFPAPNPRPLVLGLAGSATAIAEASLYGILFLLPLSFWPFSYQIYVAPKALLLRALIVLAVLAWMLASLARGRFRIFPNPLFLPMLVFLGVNLLATLLSVVPQRSWLGAGYRSDGLLTLVGYSALCFLATQLLRSPIHLRRANLCALAAAVSIAVMGLLQVYRLSPDFIGSNWIGGRATATLGNPDFLGAYMVLVWPLSVGWLIQARSRRGRAAAAAALAFLLAALALSHTRGAWIGFVGGAMVMLFFTWKQLRGVAPWLAGALVGALLLIAPSQMAIRLTADGTSPTPLLMEASTGGQTLADSFTSMAKPTETPSGSVRLHLWQAALSTVKDAPLLGTGPNSFVSVAGRYISPAYVSLAGEQELFPDKPHNQFLEIAVGSGLLGLAAYLWLLLAFARSAWRWLRIRSRHSLHPLLAALVSAWAGNLVQDLFLFDVLDTGAIFWIFMGLATVVTQRPARSWRPEVLWPPAGRWAAGAALVLVGVLALVLAWRPFAADLYLRDALLVLREPHRFPAAAQLFERALEMDGNDETILVSYAAARRVNASFSTDPGNLQEQSMKAVSLLDRAIELNPRLALLYFRRGQAWQLRPGQERTALADYRRAVELYPFYPEANAALLDLLHRMGRPEEAALAGKRLLQIRPSDPNLYFNLGLDDAAMGLWDQAIAAWQEGARLAPKDAAFPYRLGTAFAAKGDTSRARDAYRQALSLDPDHRDAREALRHADQPQPAQPPSGR